MAWLGEYEQPKPYLPNEAMHQVGHLMRGSYLSDTGLGFAVE